MIINSYKLRCSLPGHSKDVRCLTAGEVLGHECIVSGSRDKTAKLWAPEGLGYLCHETYGGNEGFVSSVVIREPIESLPLGQVITGCQDGKIRIYNPGTPNPVSMLTGHTDNVCALVVHGKFLISGSWDKTAKIWESGNISPLLTLSGHLAAIWAVEMLPSSGQALYLTGSADKTIKLWLRDSPLQLFKGHTDCVRALAVIDEQRFLSAANDATIRLWITGGECLATYYGHTNYIYGLAMMPSSTNFVSCGEDHSVRIWKLELPDECQQTIFLPAQSVWTVTVMKNHDIVTGSSDGLVRVFTNSSERMADPDVLKAYEAELSVTSLSAQLELGGIKASDLPGPESLFEPGTKEGQTKMVREGQSVACYSWSFGENQWVKVGDVVGAVGQSDSTKTLHEGKEYDLVFSVDITEGQPPLKLPYNVSQDPWQAAQKFIHTNNLSQDYLETVANFIITNSKGVAGKSATVPSSSCNTYTDPFTGASRYVPSSGNPASVSDSLTVDPFTGAGRYVPQSAPVASKPQQSFFPVRDFLRFDQANLEAITNKLKEFNGKVEPNLRLSDVDLTNFIQSADLGSSAAGDMIHLDTLLQWSPELLIPVLDILRLASRKPSINQFLARREDMPGALLSLVPSSVPNCMLIYRTMAHCVAHALPKGQSRMLDKRAVILGSIVSIFTGTDSSFEKQPQWKNVQVAASTILLNYAALMQSVPGSATLEAKSQLLQTISVVISKLQEEEALFRILAATGTLLGDQESVALACSLQLHSSLDHLHSVSGKVGECAKHVLALF